MRDGGDAPGWSRDDSALLRAVDECIANGASAPRHSKCLTRVARRSKSSTLSRRSRCITRWRSSLGHSRSRSTRRSRASRSRTLNEHCRAVGRSAIVAAARGSGKGPERSPVTVSDDDAIEEYPVNACTASPAGRRTCASSFQDVPTSRPVETPLVASVEGRGERPGRVVQALGGTPQQRCQRTGAALVRRVPPPPSPNVVSSHRGSPIHIGSHAWRGGKRLGYTAVEPCRGLVEGVIASLSEQRSLRLGGRRTETHRTRKLGYDTFASGGRVFRH